MNKKIVLPIYDKLKKAKNNVKTNNVASIGRKRRLKQFSSKDTNQQSMFTVMVMINQKLPETVKKNIPFKSDPTIKASC